MQYEAEFAMLPWEVKGIDPNAVRIDRESKTKEEDKDIFGNTHLAVAVYLDRSDINVKT